MQVLRRISCTASAIATAYGASTLRGAGQGDLVPVAKHAHNADESFQHTGPAALWGNLSRPGGDENLCISGRLAPELYVLGAPKAATTSLWMDTDRAGIKMPERSLFMGKEFRFFLVEDYNEDISKLKKKWLGNMPKCIRESREVVADFNPHNLGSVVGSLNPSRKIGAGLPPLLQDLYAERASSLTFLVMLREPIARMQSHWHMHKKSYPFIDMGATTFGDSMERLYAALEKKPKAAGRQREWTWLWESMYGTHLPVWLEHFAADRFLVVPMKEYTQGNAQAVCRELSSRMRFPIDCAGSNPESLQRTNTNVHDHVHVEEELTADLFEKFKGFFDTSNRVLFRTLSKASTGGAYLANYDGAPGDVVAIRTWLKQGW